MHALFTVFVKEFIENLRDRRTLVSALIFGPLFGPLVFGAMVSRMLDQSVTESDATIALTVSGSEHAPNLMAYLKMQGLHLTLTPLTESAARARVQSGAAPVVLLVPAEYGTRFLAASPAPLLLFADSSDSQTRKHAERVRQLLAAFGAGIAQQRLQARGVSPTLTIPVAVNDVDVATASGRAVIVVGFMTYFVLFSLLMGGLYLAIDSTAGERERGSLEALLSLPVPRLGLVGGKLLATCAYMSLSLGICLCAFVAVFRFIALERLGMSANIGIGTAAVFFGICLPFIPLGASLMVLVASFSRSYREAQTYLTSVLLVPTLPIAFASIYSLKAKTTLMFIPSLSQHLLMTSVLKDQVISPLDFAISALSSLVLASILTALTAAHWRRESLLG